jgi:hypothetical protein
MTESSGQSPWPTFRVAEGVVQRGLVGETILLNLKTGVYFGFDEDGSRI